MDQISTYGFLGIPDGVATAFVLVSLSLMLAPWFGGLEIGPLKVPKLNPRRTKILRCLTPLAFVASLSCFFPIWSPKGPESKNHPLNELALQWLEENFGETVWDGGKQWGEVVFKDSGRKARYSNAPGRSEGSIEILGGDFSGTGFIIFSGIWTQDDGRDGVFELVAGYGDDALVRWGPDKSISNDWVKMNNELPSVDEGELPILRWASLQDNAESFGPIFVDSLKVQAAGTSGRTAHRILKIDAGDGKAFLPESIDFEEMSRSGGGRVEARFLKDRFQFVEVSINKNGKAQTVRLPQEIYILMHAETGSGAANFNRGAWINGNVTARVIEIPD